MAEPLSGLVSGTIVQSRECCEQGALGDDLCVRHVFAACSACDTSVLAAHVQGGRVIPHDPIIQLQSNSCSESAGGAERPTCDPLPVTTSDAQLPDVCDYFRRVIPHENVIDNQLLCADDVGNGAACL